MKLFVTILSLGCSLAVWGQNAIQFVDADFKSILEKAKKEKKLVFMDAYASWCGPCKLMEKNVFTDAKVADYYNASFVNARFDMEKGEGRSLAQNYKVRSYPTYLFLNGDGEVVGLEMGYMQSDEFLALGRRYNKPSNAKGSLQERFDKGERDGEFLISFFNTSVAINPVKAKQAAEYYFKAKKDLKFSNEEVNMLFGSIQSNQDFNYDYIIKNKEALVGYIGKANYEQFLFRVNIQGIIEGAANIEKKSFNDQYFLEEASKFIPMEEAKSMLTIIKMNFFQTTENWASYEVTTLQVFNNGEGFPAQDLVKACELFNEHVTSKVSLEKASIWAEKALMSEDSYRTNAILAELYFKIGKRLEAKAFAESALLHARGKNMDVQSLSKIINSN